MSRHRLTRSSRALTFVALAAAVVVSACADLIGTGRGSAGTARVVLQPRFSQRDAEIYRGLPVFGLGVQTLRIVLLRPATTDTLADTTVIVDESQDSIAVKLTVVLNQAEEQLTAAMQMFSGEVLVFEGTRSITARAGVDLVGAAPTLVPVWVGPGASAVTLEIEPGDTTINPDATLDLVARAFDAGSNEITDPDYLGRLRWTVLDPALGSIPEEGGTFTGAGTEGVARVMVFAPNLLRDTIEITLAIPTDPTSIELASSFDIVNVGATVTRAATVRTENGTVLPAAPVTYTSRAPAIATVDASGVITGVAPGQAIIVAQVTSNPALADSLLAVVAHVGGPVVYTSLHAFDLGTSGGQTVAILVDMRSTKKLGSTTIDVEWDPARLTYVSHAAGSSLTPTVNATNAAAGKITLAMADPSGFSNLVELLNITFSTTSSAGPGFLKATARELNEANAAVTDLLPITVNVIHTLRTH